MYSILFFQVKEFRAHTAIVNDLSFDTEGEYVGSCSDDGSVVINSLFTDERMRFEYHRPTKAIALDPDYAKKTSRRFAAGGLAGHLYLNSKKWLGYKDQVLNILFATLVEKYSLYQTTSFSLLSLLAFVGLAFWRGSNTRSKMENKPHCLGK